MTTVAALARDGHVVMAADSATNIFDRPVGGARKIVRLPVGDRGEALVGCSGGAAGIDDLIAAKLTLPRPPDLDADPQPWAAAAALAASALLVDAGITHEGRMDACLILGWSGRLWSLDHASAIAHPDGIAAVGSGEAVAIGAMDALLAACPQLPPTEVVTRAVAIAIEWDRHSAEPIQVEALPAAGA